MDNDMLREAERIRGQFPDGLVAHLLTEIERLRSEQKISAHLLREREIEDQFLAIANEKMSGPVKVTAIATRRELVNVGHTQSEAGSVLMPRSVIALRCGIKEPAAGAHMIELERQGVIVREKHRTFDETSVYVGPGPLFNVPQAVKTPERAYPWGGKREKLRKGRS